MKISTTITKKFFDMKMQDLEKYGVFWEYKEDKPFWKKRLDKFESSAEIVFIVGKIPHRFLVVDIFQMHRSHIPARYRSAIQTDFTYVIKCVGLPTERRVA